MTLKQDCDTSLRSHHFYNHNARPSRDLASYAAMFSAFSAAVKGLILRAVAGGSIYFIKNKNYPSTTCIYA